MSESEQSFLLSSVKVCVKWLPNLSVTTTREKTIILPHRQSGFPKLYLFRIKITNYSLKGQPCSEPNVSRHHNFIISFPFFCSFLHRADELNKIPITKLLKTSHSIAKQGDEVISNYCLVSSHNILITSRIKGSGWGSPGNSFNAFLPSLNCFFLSFIPSKHLFRVILVVTCFCAPLFHRWRSCSQTGSCALVSSQRLLAQFVLWLSKYYSVWNHFRAGRRKERYRNTLIELWEHCWGLFFFSEMDVTY